MARVLDILKSPFAFLFTRTKAEEVVAEYVIREHHRGRSLEDILDDAYVTNRLTPDQARRLLDRPDLVHAIGSDLVAEQADAPAPRAPARRLRSRASSTTRAPTARSHAAIPFDLKRTTSSGERAALHLAGDDLLELVHLEPVEDAALDRLDQVARLEPRLLERVAADERRALEHRVVELACAPGRSRPTAQTSAPSRAIRREAPDPSRSSP